jgi:predicted exporter
LAQRLEEARVGMPFRRIAFDGFVDAVRTSRQMTPLLPSDLFGTAFGDRLTPLLFEQAGVWRGPVAFQTVPDPARLAAALAEAGIGNAGSAIHPTAGAAGTNASAEQHAGDLRDGVIYIDMRAELSRILAGYTAQAWRWLGWSCLMVVATLAVGLRTPARLFHVLGAIAAAILVTIALLTLIGARLSLIHLVALQLVAGVGLDYALFFARRQLDTEERARTLRTLVTCNAMTLLTFGMLAACQTPLLRDIGMTVALGAVLAMLFGFLFAGPRPSRAAPGMTE